MEVLMPFFNVILKGESKTYNDHNWYVGDLLKSYIENTKSSPYSLLTKPLSDYTVGEVMQFQRHPRDRTGQLWATGRYQIIPDTLKGLIKNAKVSLSDKYDKQTQDKLGLQLLKDRKAVKLYIFGEVPDTTENLNKAITGVAMTWSSVGVPQDMKGKRRRIKKGESYYSGGGDRASISPESVGDALKKLRSVLTGKVLGDTVDYAKKNPLPTIFVTTALVFGIYVLITQTNKI